jgi:hypothetical protein
MSIRKFILKIILKFLKNMAHFIKENKIIKYGIIINLTYINL